jgi:hypothetical protein
MRRGFNSEASNRVPPSCRWDIGSPAATRVPPRPGFNSQKYIFFRRALAWSYYTKDGPDFNVPKGVYKHLQVMMRRISSRIKANVEVKRVMPDFIEHGRGMVVLNRGACFD